MKNIRKIYFLVLSFATLVSCSYEPEIGSRETNYPLIIVDPIKVITLGSNYTAVAKVTEGGKPIPYTIEGEDEVNENTVGVYNVTFSATNQDGYEGAATQTVIVHNPSIIGTNVSGNIQDKRTTTRKGVITLIDGTTSIFYCTDFAFGGVFPMYFQMNGNVISEIKQSYINGVTNVDLTYSPATKLFTTKVNPQGFAYTFEYY